MLPQRKHDHSFLSVPVSRVPSSQRLNQLGTLGLGGGPLTPGNPYSSIPSTPNAYVSSSLNPSRNTNYNANNSTNYNANVSSGSLDLLEFENIPLVQGIRELEEQLTVLSTDIASYREDRIEDTIKKMIKLNDTIFAEIDEMKRQQVLATRVRQLDQEKTQLDTLAKSTLKTLLDYRSQLKKLPSLPSQKRSDSSQNVLDVKEVLKYAMRLSKFTKMPSSSLDPSMNVHPNNFVWPAEDALRRGMLALSSLNEEAVLKLEIGDGNDDTPEQKDHHAKDSDEQIEDVLMEDVERQEVERQEAPRYRNDPVKTAEHKAPEEKPTMVSLDLFDPEDDFSD